MATNTGQKYIICDVATQKYGKTLFLKEVAKLLKTNPSLTLTHHNKRWRKDEWFVLVDKSTNKSILVQTKGDNLKSFSDTVNYLKNNIVDIIVCARHSRGNTVKIVQQLKSHYNYSELDFTHMFPNPRTLMNWKQPAIRIAESKISRAIYEIVLSL